MRKIITISIAAAGVAAIVTGAVFTIRAITRRKGGYEQLTVDDYINDKTLSQQAGEQNT